MIPFRKSIGFRLLGISIILLSLPLLVDSFIFLESHYERTTHEARAVLAEEINLRISPFQKLQENMNKTFSMILYFLDPKNDIGAQASSLNEKFKDLASINNYHAVILLHRTEEGKLISAGSNLPEYAKGDLTDMFSSPDPFTQEGKRRGYVTSFLRIKDQVYQYIAKGLFTSDGKPKGVFIVIGEVEFSLRLLLKPDELPFRIDFALLSPSSLITQASDPSLRYHYFHKLTPAEIANFQKIEPGVELPEKPLLTSSNIHLPYMVFEWEHEKQLGVIKNLEGTSNLLLAYAKLSDVLSGPFDRFMWYYGSFIIIFIIGVIIAYFGTKRLTKPISVLSLVMHKIKEGDLKVRYKEQRLGFEINRIGLVFNEMVDILIEKEKAYEEERVIKETFEKELALGRDVQNSILPMKMPQMEGVELAQAFIPSIQVGGDFYDAYIKENGKLVVAVADASGKGVRACCYALSVKSMLRGFAKQSDDVAEVSQMTNNLFCKDTGETGMFVTVLLGQYDPSMRTFDFFSSGHNALIHYDRKEKTAKMLDFLDMAMGVMEKPENKKGKQIHVASGDLILLYSDGVTEAHNIHSELYGDERLLQFVEREAGRGATDFVSHLVEELANFKGEAAQHDDITLLVLKIR